MDDSFFFYILQNNQIFSRRSPGDIFFLLVTEIIKSKREKAVCVSFSFTHTLTKNSVCCVGVTMATFLRQMERDCGMKAGEVEEVTHTHAGLSAVVRTFIDISIPLSLALNTIITIKY